MDVVSEINLIIIIIYCLDTGIFPNALKVVKVKCLYSLV